MKRKSLLFVLLMVFLAPLAMNAQETLLVHDGTTTNQYVPFYGYYADESQQNQMIYPASELTTEENNMTGAEITQMVFYYSSLGSGGTGVGTWTVSLGETRNTTLSGLDNSTTLTEVFTGGLDALFNTTDKTLTITFDNGYTYQGGNLLVEFSHEASGWKQCYFYGETVTGASYCYGGQRNFLPKTTFTYEPASNCAKPTDLAVNYTSGATTATVTWSGDARAYNIDVNGTVTNGVTSPYTLGNLTPNTTYTIKVQSDCGDEQSGWALAGSFTTPCSAYAIPYAYGFEDENDMTCWSMVNIPSDATGLTGVQTNAWAESNLDDDFARSGNNFFFFLYYAYSSQGAPFQTLISPELSGISNGLHVEFYYSGYSNGIETFKVGYSTTDNDPDSFIWGNEITASSSYQRFSANYPAETKYVAVQHTSDDQYYLFLDDFLFEESASCLEPSNVQVADVTTTGATISWTAGGEETAWDIFIIDDATVEPDDTTTPTVAGTEDNPYSLTDLDPATIYYVYVRAICGEDEASAWSSPVIFNTECNAMALPYNYGFEDATLPVCWNTIVENTSYTGINVMAPSTSSTNQVLAFYMGTSQNPALVAVLPEVDEAYPLNRYQITFDACYANTSSSSMTSGKLGIGIMTDPADFSTFELIEEVNITVSYSSFGTYNVWFNSYTGNGRYIAIRDIYTQSGYVLVDNIEVTELPACLQPTNLTVEGGKNAVVTWEGDAESFDIAYSTDNTVDPAEHLVGETTENTFNLGEAVNLTEGDYYVWVRANCGTDGYSEWTDPASFHVGYCTPNPTSHDGKGITGVSFGTGDYVVTNGDGSASVPASSPYYGDYTSMIGAVQAGVESTIAITTGTNSYPYTFVIWVDLDNSMSFEDSDIVYIGKASAGNGTLNATITIPATQATGDYRMRIYGADSYFTSFYGNGTTNWNADHDPCSSGTYRHAHDYTLRVLEAPSCLPAGEVTVAPESITSTSAVISWTNYNGDEATYTVMQGENVLTTTAVDSYTLTLTAATNYPAGTFTIISNCDETMIANVPAFSTPCEDITTLPWSEDFEGFEINTVPMCWDNSASTSYISSSSSSPNCIWGVVTVDDNNMIKMENYWAQNGTALINTPTIVLPAEGVYQLSFDYAHNANCGAFAVKVSTDNGTTFTELASYTQGSGSSHTEPGDFTPASISLADYAGESIILQFFANANYGSGAIFVDNVEISLMPSITLENIAGYQGSDGNWYLIASPLADAVKPTKVDNLINTNGYDLYRFNQSASLQWENYKNTTHTESFMLEPGQGYLYANNDGGDITFYGTSYSGTGVVTLTYDENVNDEKIRGLNLVGNPFNDNATIDKDEYYVMNSDRNDVTIANGDYVIKPMEGIFVYAENANDKVTFTPASNKSSRKASVVMNLSNNSNVIDRAIVRLGQGNNMPKFQLFENSTKLYIEQNNEDFAVVSADNQGEMPVNFKAAKNGTYTLSFNTENIEMGYLHLIDNLTGNDVDLLATPSYSFEANTSDYASRFRLVFSAGNDDQFAFISNGEIVLNGQGTAQVYDVTGRMISSHYNATRIATENMAAGVYVIRLINGENVKTQKIVVK